MLFTLTVIMHHGEFHIRTAYVNLYFTLYYQKPPTHDKLF